MPFGKEGIEKGTALALSGGGFRATLFHLGSLWRLNELGLLSKLARISSVSGGSITSGVLALKWKNLNFVGGIADNFVDLIDHPERRRLHRRNRPRGHSEHCQGPVGSRPVHRHEHPANHVVRHSAAGRKEGHPHPGGPQFIHPEGHGHPHGYRH